MQDHTRALIPRGGNINTAIIDSTVKVVSTHQLHSVF